MPIIGGNLPMQHIDLHPGENKIVFVKNTRYTHVWEIDLNKL